MCRLVTFLTCLLLSLSAGCGTYALGAITWCTIDPDGAGAKLLFTIPVALVGMAVPGIVGLLCCAFRCEFIRAPKPATVPARAPLRSAPARRPATATAPATPMDEDMELALAT
jgi:hypothetical protein